MEVVLNLGGFECLGQNEMLSVDGGADVSVGEALVATGGAVLIAWTPIVVVAAIAAGIATGGVALPVVVATAVGTGLGTLGIGITGVAASLH